MKTIIVLLLLAGIFPLPRTRPGNPDPPGPFPKGPIFIRTPDLDRNR